MNTSASTPTFSPSRADRRWLLLPLAALIGAGLAALPPFWAALILVLSTAALITLIRPLAGLGIALLLGPFKPLSDLYLPGLPLDPGQLALIVTLAAWALRALREHELRIPESPLNAPLLILISAMTLSLLNALSLGSGLEELIKWVQIALVMWLVAEEGQRVGWGWALALIFVAAVSQAAIGVWQFGLRGDGPEHFLILGGRFYRASGSFQQPNPFGGFMGLGLTLAAGLAIAALEAWWDQALPSLEMRPWRFDTFRAAFFNQGFPRLVLFTGVAGLLAAGLLASWSRGAWLGVAAGAAVMLFAWPRKVSQGALLLLAAVMLGLILWLSGLLPDSITSRLTDFGGFSGSVDVRGVWVTDANFSVIERLAHWQAALEMARYHPLLGVGVGNYEVVYPLYGLAAWENALGHAHNIYLNALAETGAIGLAAYLAFWMTVIIVTWRLIRHSNGLTRGIALGLLGTWTHLSVHHFFDKLYVANLHLHIAGMLGILTLILLQNRARPARSHD